MCTSLMGKIGGAFAMVGVIACPITSGDTALEVQGLQYLIGLK